MVKRRLILFVGLFVYGSSVLLGGGCTPSRCVQKDSLLESLEANLAKALELYTREAHKLLPKQVNPETGDLFLLPSVSLPLSDAVEALKQSRNAENLRDLIDYLEAHNNRADLRPENKAGALHRLANYEYLIMNHCDQRSW